MKRGLMLAAAGLTVALTAQTVNNAGGAASTVSQGTAAAASGAWPVKITDGSSTAQFSSGNLRVIAGGVDPNNAWAYNNADVTAPGDGESTSWGRMLSDSVVEGYNGSGYDRLRTTMADGSSKTGVLETAAVATAYHISGQGTWAAKSGAGILHRLTINTPAVGTVTIYDVAGGSCTGTPGSGIIAAITLTSSSQPETLTYDVKMTNGVCIETPPGFDGTIGME